MDVQHFRFRHVPFTTDILLFSFTVFSNLFHFVMRCVRHKLPGICRWFDKSFNLIVFKNGRFGLNAEHSWADAPIVSYLCEETLGYEFLSLKYNPDGTVGGKPGSVAVKAERLKWVIPDQVRKFRFSKLQIVSEQSEIALFY